MSEIYEPTTIRVFETLAIHTLSDVKKEGQQTILQKGKKNKIAVDFFLYRVKVHTFGYYDKWNFLIFEPDPCNPMTIDHIFWSSELLSPVEYEPGNVVCLTYNVHILPQLENYIVCEIKKKQ